eukprot:TRINITY_DN1726_c0_g1_i1.p1 TRINITY_DN1726_c0_g1~~TRINITY_DN1726_c0_g1_i1.p1  ORF type:complete len:380 (+),score=119.82 TRINITY_DN1726_c0_g1_i1:123-1262(+)
MGNEVSSDKVVVVKFCQPNHRLPDKREAHSLVSLPDGSLLLFGGARLTATGREETNALWSWQPDNGWSEVRPKTDSNLPPARACAASCALGDRLFVFGGLSSNSGWLGDLAVFDSQSQTWTVHSTPSDSVWPPARDKAAMCAVGPNRAMLFGGFGPKDSDSSGDDDDEMGSDDDEDGAEFGWFNDVHFLDTDTATWSRPTVTGTPPTPRAAFGMCSIGSKVYVFGGRDTMQRVNDVHVFDVDTCSWSQPQTHGTPPPPRSFHSMARVGSKLIVFGGLSRHNAHFNDVHFFDTATSTWHEAAVDAAGKPAARGYAAVVTIGSTVFLTGGSAGFDSSTQENGVYFDDLYMLDASPIESYSPPPTTSGDAAGAPSGSIGTTS